MNNSNSQAEYEVVFQEDKPKKKVWLWWLGGCGLLACIALCIIVAFLLLYPSDEASYPLDGNVSFPATVQKGDEFDFMITLTNSTTEPVFIKHFTLQNYVGLPSLFDGARVISVEPHMESEPLFEKELQYPYFQEIKSGETLTVIFRFRAENTGTYFIDIGVYARHPSRADPAFITAFWYGPAEIAITP